MHMASAPFRFKGKVRYFRPALKSGLAVIDIPKTTADGLGGLKQMRVEGRLNGPSFKSNTMPAGAGVLAFSVSKKLLDQAGLQVGDTADLEVARAQ